MSLLPSFLLLSFYRLLDWKMSVGFGTVWDKGFFSLAVTFIVSILIKGEF